MGGGGGVSPGQALQQDDKRSFSQNKMQESPHLPDQNQPEVDAVHGRVVDVEDDPKLKPAHAELEATQEVEKALGSQSLSAK